MGAVTYLPYAHSKNDAAVPIWNGFHAIVDHTTGANVTCELPRSNGLWYKLATRDDLHMDEPGRDQVPMSGRYISAELTNLLSVPAGYVWGRCRCSCDHPGRWYPGRAVLVTATALAAVLAARTIIKRRRPRPEPPPVT
jgi:hypothetical protein